MMQMQMMQMIYDKNYLFNRKKIRLKKLRKQMMKRNIKL